MSYPKSLRRLIALLAKLPGVGDRITSYNVCYTKLLRNLFARLEKEDLLSKRRSIFVYSLRWAAVPLAAAAALALFLLPSREPVRDLSPTALRPPQVVITSYSIHYTKLYDHRREGGGGTRFSRLRRRGTAGELTRERLPYLIYFRA